MAVGLDLEHGVESVKGGKVRTRLGSLHGFYRSIYGSVCTSKPKNLRQNLRGGRKPREDKGLGAGRNGEDALEG